MKTNDDNNNNNNNKMPETGKLEQQQPPKTQGGRPEETEHDLSNHVSPVESNKAKRTKRHKRDTTKATCWKQLSAAELITSLLFDERPTKCETTQPQEPSEISRKPD
eukprot:2450886-Amphidinium_carterae.1